MDRYRYHRINVYLAGQPAAITSVTLALAEIEALLAGPLPAIAWTRTWWSAVRSSVWLAADWRVTDVSMRTAPPTITFTR